MITVLRKLKSAVLIMALLSPLYLHQNSESSTGGPVFLQVHFTSTISNISERQAEQLISGKITNFKDLGGDNSVIKIFVDKGISSFLRKEYPQLKFTECDLFSAGDYSKKNFLGICSLEALSPCCKTLYVESSLPWGRIDSDYALSSPSDYPLRRSYAPSWSDSEHVSVIQTGVTAMTRAFIPAVDKGNDVCEPVKETWRITSEADISITSNEVSFDENCSYPFPNRMKFCSPYRYFEILKKSGFNMIELTGNHNNDYGRDNSARTIELYKKNGINYFGGGLNEKEASDIKYINVKGRKFAFIGFNQWGPAEAWASADQPGACRLSEEKYYAAVGEAVANADFVFVSVQWGNENDPVPYPIQKEYFRKAADMGATIMVSSSSHRAMGLEFHSGKFISYGLGNFLFDQMQTVNHRRGMIARHHFYGKKHISTELIPYLIYNHSQPRLQKGKDAQELMREVYKYSLGSVFGK
ncbi:MAG: CapA family protein [Spirochaetes bacterium]|nr:CapA family protein [Spirochaetota bacterium]